MNPYSQTSLESEFQTQCNRLYDGHPVDWKFVRVHLGYMTTVHNKELFWKMYRYIMNCFKALKIKDSSVISDVLQLSYLMCMHERISQFRSNYFKGSGGEELLKCMKVNIPGYVLYRYNSVYKLMTVPQTKLKDLESYTFSWNLLPVLCAFSNRYIDLVVDLVKYGVIDRSPLYDDPEQLRAGSVMFNIQEYYFDRSKSEEDVTTGPVLVSEEAWERYFRVCRTLDMFLCIKETSRRRIKRTWSDRDHSGSRSELIRAFRMILNSIPEPFPSGEEIRKYLRSVFCDYVKYKKFESRQQRRTFDIERVISRIIKEFAEILPQSAEPLAPRSLRHLSRCQIRDNMRIAGSLPHGVEELVLPHSLKQYILLHEDY